MVITHQDIRFACFAALAGIISGLSGPGIIFGIPGIAFGITVAIWFSKIEKINKARTISYAVCSAIAYEVAYMTVVGLPDTHYSTLFDSYFFVLFIAGVVGSFILALSTHFLISKLTFKQISLLVILGGVFGLFFEHVLRDAGKWQPQASPVLPFILWQVVIGVALVQMVNKNRIIIKS